MRIREGEFVPSLVMEAYQINPEAVRAQRMAELKDIAEYRARRLQAIKDWSVAEKRETIQRKAQEELRIAKDLWTHMVAEDLNKLEMHMPSDADKFANKILVRVLEKATPHKPWWRKVLDWLTGN